MWLDDAVVYQVYMRSFQDSDGDGVGDLTGVTSRLEHIAALGADAVWLSPIYPSPNADYGYDVADYTAIDPAFGTLDDFDALVDRAHALGLKVVLDFVPCHTSTAHRWFREHPDYYVWADAPLNNWMASFGGTAWEHDEQTGRYYLHSFFPEQADLDWHNPEVRRVIGEALQFWLQRGVEGYRLDALDRLLKDPQLRDDPVATDPPPLPLDPEYATLEHLHSVNAPDIGTALQSIRDAVGDATLIGEVYLPADRLGPYLEVLDTCFAFEALQSPQDAAALKDRIERSLAAGRVGWVLSNHDFSRLGTRFGPDNARAVAMLLLSLPGPAFVFQGDELGMTDGEPLEPALDRFHRDPFRRTMPWGDERGFTTGTPWLPTGDGVTPSVAEQRRDPSSQLAMTTAMIAVRRQMSGAATLLDSARDTIVVRRGEHIIVVNLGDEDRPAPRFDELLAEAHPGDASVQNTVSSHGAFIARASR